MAWLQWSLQVFMKVTCSSVYPYLQTCVKTTWHLVQCHGAGRSLLTWCLRHIAQSLGNVVGALPRSYDPCVLQFGAVLYMLHAI